MTTTQSPAPIGGSAGGRLGLTQRRLTAKAKTEAVQSMQRFVRLEFWNGMAAGDVVRVTGHSSRGRHWRFRAHVTNTSNGATWVEVALVEGPPPSRRPGSEEDESPRVEKVRSFEPGLVAPRWRGRMRPKGKHKQSADEAPAAAGGQQAALF
ncbi:MAG TPA: hypothetical protein VGP46_04205 [Acidimicrobiales bacterium]|nr:hypothetical protein [Acidimicrobiales bacterium]